MLFPYICYSDSEESVAPKAKCAGARHTVFPTDGFIRKTNTFLCFVSMFNNFMWHNYFDVRNNLFTREQCEEIIKQREVKQYHQSILGPTNQPVRDSNCYFFNRQENPVIDTGMQKMLSAVHEYNKAYNFELSVGLNFVQLTEYVPNQYYDTHIDLGAGPASCRKVTIVVQLSDTTTHDGGISFCYDVEKIHKVDLRQGDAVIFPSFIQHRADTVTYGTRHSLVGWVLGASPFK